MLEKITETSLSAVLSLIVWRQFQTKARENNRAVSIGKKDHGSHTRRHQQIHSELHVHAAGHEYAAGAAAQDCLSLDRTGKCRRMGGCRRLPAHHSVFWPADHCSCDGVGGG